MTYFDRYKDGQFVAVRNELSALGGAVREPAIFSDAMSVAQVTMERVATNIGRLIERLTSHGYEFGVYPDSTRFPVNSAALLKPDAESRAHMVELERLAGTIPLLCATGLVRRGFAQLGFGKNVRGYRRNNPPIAPPIAPIGPPIPWGRWARLPFR
jgi:hypothetical protein